MSKTKSRPKKIASRFMSTFFAFCFAMLCVPNLSVFAASIVQPQVRNMTVHNGGQSFTLTLDSRVKRGLIRSNPQNMITLKPSGYSPYIYNVVVKDNPNQRDRTAVIEFYGATLYYSDIGLPTARPLYRYNIKQEGKKITAYPQYDACEVALSGTLYPMFVESNCPFMLDSAEDIHIFPNKVKVYDAESGSQLDARSDGYYGTFQKGLRKYKVECVTRLNYSQTKIVLTAGGTYDHPIEYNLYSGDANCVSDFIFTSIGNKFETKVSAKTRNLAHFTQETLWSKTKFSTVFPDISNDPDDLSYDLAELRGGVWVKLGMSPNGVFTKLENNDWHISIDASPSSIYLYWDTAYHGFVCHAVNSGDEETTFDQGAELFMPLMEFEITSRTDYKMKMYKLSYKPAGNDEVEYKRSTEYNFTYI